MAYAGDMTDSTSSESGGSGYSRRNSRRIHGTDCLLSNPKLTNNDSPMEAMSFSVDEQSLVGERNYTNLGAEIREILTESRKTLEKLHLRNYFLF